MGSGLEASRARARKDSLLMAAPSAQSSASYRHRKQRCLRRPCPLTLMREQTGPFPLQWRSRNWRESAHAPATVAPPGDISRLRLGKLCAICKPSAGRNGRHRKSVHMNCVHAFEYYWIVPPTTPRTSVYSRRGRRRARRGHSVMKRKREKVGESGVGGNGD